MNRRLVMAVAGVIDAPIRKKAIFLWERCYTDITDSQNGFRCLNTLEKLSQGLSLAVELSKFEMFSGQNIGTPPRQTAEGF